MIAARSGDFGLVSQILLRPSTCIFRVLTMSRPGVQIVPNSRTIPLFLFKTSMGLPYSEILQFGDGINQSDFIQEFNRQYQFYLRLFKKTLIHHCLSESALAQLEYLMLFLQQTLPTFTKDPSHQLCHSIPCDNNSWSELSLGLGDRSGVIEDYSKTSPSPSSVPTLPRKMASPRLTFLF